MPGTIKRVLRFFGWTLFVTGALMGLYGCVQTVSGVATRVGAADGVATSIDVTHAPGQSRLDKHRERSVITFRTVDGQVVSSTHPMGGIDPPYEMQEHVRVMYDADAPEDAVVPSGLAWLTVARVLLLVAGLVQVLMGAGFLALGALPWQSRSR